MAGPSVVLIPHAYQGALLGKVGAFSGTLGQLYGLSLLLIPTILTIVVVRWDGRANGDPKALACLWTGGLTLAAPRLIGDGSALAEMTVFGASVGVGTLAMIWGLLWLGLRFIAEFRG
jgi:hypothetical protein